MLVVLGIYDPVGPEGHVPDGRIEEVVRETSSFVAVYGDIRLLIELAGDAARDAVQLDPIEFRSRHALRHEAEEVSRAAGGLQDVAGAEPHPLQGAVDRFDDGGGRVVRIEGGGAGRGILLVTQKPLEFRILFAPRLVVFVKRLGQTTPADVPGQDLLLLGSGQSALALDAPQGADRLDVAGILRLRSPGAEGVVRYPIVASRSLFPSGLRKLLFCLLLRLIRGSLFRGDVIFLFLFTGKGSRIQRLLGRKFRRLRLNDGAIIEVVNKVRLSALLPSELVQTRVE